MKKLFFAALLSSPALATTAQLQPPVQLSKTGVESYGVSPKDLDASLNANVTLLIESDGFCTVVYDVNPPPPQDGEDFGPDPGTVFPATSGGAEVPGVVKIYYTGKVTKSGKASGNGGYVGDTVTYDPPTPDRTQMCGADGFVLRGGTPYYYHYTLLVNSVSIIDYRVISVRND